MKIQLNVALVLCLLLLTFSGTAQITFITSGQTFTDLGDSDIAFADVDGDNDQDFIINGFNGTIALTKLYLNDGNGNFTEDVLNSFIATFRGDLAFADIDGDNDQDIIITGDTGTLLAITRLYRNNGSGIFTLDNTNTFDGAFSSSILFEDVDNDLDLDVLISGWHAEADYRTRLYINDGSGSFSAQTPFVFKNVQNAANAFADIDGDNDLDLLVTGRDDIAPVVASLYRNDGSGNFSLISGSNLQEIEAGVVAFADIDGDTDNDLLVSGGLLGLFTYIKLYQNDGTGVFTEINGIPFDEVYLSSASFIDIDKDTDQDLFLSGVDIFGNRHTKLYINDGTGNFSVSAMSFTGVSSGDIALADVDGDLDTDVLISGFINSNPDYTTTLYLNDLNVLGHHNPQKETIGIISNPAKNYLHLYKDDMELDYVIYNISGQKVDSGVLTQSEASISISKLSIGLYIIQLKNQIKTKSLKFIKN